ncbi:MAG: dihydroorotase [Geminicoccaceae bacterium]|nr:dihydroorotase [Geminicoccaceae bacterium]MCX8100382.1 dihydroorotase [Geminicoccaceae bacterium]MDW8369498.1 dihydroorotase [Geminicoccaceae bacterium]
MSRPVLIVDARLLDPASGLDRRGGVLVVDGRIAELGPQVTAALAPPGSELVDARGLCLIPGLVDLRASFGEPGAEHKERFESGCLAAVAGGVTSLALLPDTDPPIDDPAMVEFVARRARRAKLAKVHPQAAVTRGLEGRELAELGLLKAAGAVAFTDGFKAVADARVMRRALAYASMLDALVVQHPEEPSLAEGGVMNEGPIASRLGLAGIPAAAEVITIERDLRLLELTGGRLHVAHVTTAAGVAAIRAAKARGLAVTCDTTPHHLLLTEAEVEGYRTFAKVSPPLREETDREAVIAGLVDGTIDAIASDHCPQDQDSKRLPFAQAAFGVIGLQTLLSASLELVFAGRIGLLELVRRLTAAPAAILGLEAGRLARGAPADLVLVDLERSWTVTEKSLFSLAKNTPFEGRTFRGKVVRTLVDGRTVYEAHDPL